MNNKKADKRRKGSSEKSMASNNTANSMGMIFIGWLTWGIATYWLFHGNLEVTSCAILGIIVSFLISRFGRKNAPFTLFILPIVLAAVFGG